MGNKTRMSTLAISASTLDVVAWATGQRKYKKPMGRGGVSQIITSDMWDAWIHTSL